MRRATVLTLLLAFAAGCAGGEQDYADAMAEQHAGDTPTPTTAVQEPMAPVEADTVTYGTLDGEPLTGFMAVPARPDSFLAARGLPADAALAAVIVIHEWWGLNDNIRTMTRRLAGEGYRALAIDLYGGAVATTPEEARALVQEATAAPEQATANLEAAYRFLAETHAAPRVASLGWCFGGRMSLQAALAMPDRLDAAVIYYGHLDAATPERLETLQMPILGIFGAEDESIPLEDVRHFEQTLQELGKEVQVYVYDNAGHAFANPSGQNYVEEAAADAWDKTTAFLRTHLYGEGADQ